jgi:hypothetical protein
LSLLDDLLARGYFPVQLPPGFVSDEFASKRNRFEAQWLSQKPPRTSPVRFSVPRSSFNRRVTALVNPIAFLRLSHEIERYWTQICAHLAQSRISKSTPVPSPGLRAISLKKFSELHEERILQSAGCRYALVTDISSFFPTIYTHTIPWALHSKSVAKKIRDKTPAMFGNILDERCMGVQDGQTKGLPIGPDTSHIIAEIIAVSIDIRLREILGTWPKGFRYVDDFFFFFGSRPEAERALAAVTQSVSGFELQLNAAKTKIVEVKEIVEESWKYGLKRTRISSNRRRQRDDIHRFFETLFALERRFRDESIVKYGLKVLSATIVKKSNWALFEAYLLKCIGAFPNTLQIVTHLLVTYRHYRYALNDDAIARLSSQLILDAAESDQHCEVAWLLWIYKELDLPLSLKAVRAIEKMANSVCTLLALDICKSRKQRIAFRRKQLIQLATAAGLEGVDWLLAYEGGRRRWLGNKSTQFIASHSHFGSLLKAGVKFYDSDRRLAPIFHFRKDAPARPSRFNFDTDDEIGDDFEFDDIDEEYFDSAPGGDDEGDEDVDEDGSEDSDTDEEHDF